MVHSPRPYRTWQCRDRFVLRRGGELAGFELAYETWGELNEARDNAVVILHALSGTSHALGTGADAPGWWDGVFADDSPLNPRTHFIVCCNLLGGCDGSTGPASIDPRSSRPFGVEFPPLTMEDLVESYRLLLGALGVDQPVTVIGGSMGGMLALEWAVRHPDEVRRTIALVAPGRSFAQTIALRSVQRDAITLDPNYRGGDYYGGRAPEDGLALARRIGMITYRSSPEFEARFGRDVRDPRPHFRDGLFEVQSYLNHQGRKLVDRFDANTYLYFSRAMDLYDLAEDYGSMAAAAERITAPVLLLGASSDILCPLEQIEEVRDALRCHQKACTFETLQSEHGHDSFLIETAQIRQKLREFIASV